MTTSNQPKDRYTTHIELGNVQLAYNKDYWKKRKQIDLERKKALAKLVEPTNKGKEV